MVLGFGKREEKDTPKEAEYSLKASEIVKRQEMIDNLNGRYLLLEASSFNSNWNDQLKAMNLMAEKGWRCVNICNQNQMIYALMEKIS